MANTISLDRSNQHVKSALLDIFALVFVYFVPTLSHLAQLPLYLLEPMRIMLILAIAHTTRKNAYLLALTLPLFSFVISMHPSLVKSILITAELLLNVWLFYFLLKKTNNHFVAMISSIVASKAVYYLAKFIMIQAVVLETGLISTPLTIQAITTFIFSGYIFLIFRRREVLADEK
ncbi:MAG: hypothetical protein KDC05_08095 [Bacteroidales bacterium]|nr:hypothetical protein [Bacteroidales bacterium]